MALVPLPLSAAQTVVDRSDDDALKGPYASSTGVAAAESPAHKACTYGQALAGNKPSLGVSAAGSWLRCRSGRSFCTRLL